MHTLTTIFSDFTEDNILPDIIKRKPSKIFKPKIRLSNIDYYTIWMQGFIIGIIFAFVILLIFALGNIFVSAGQTFIN